MVFNAFSRAANKAIDALKSAHKTGSRNRWAPPRPAFSLLSVDAVLTEVDKALKTLTSSAQASRPSPGAGKPDITAELSGEQKNDVIGMMRINHVGEVCAQALYHGQAMASKDAAKKALFKRAAQEETDHLAWTEERLEQLGGRPSLLNPLWYGGSLALGYVAGQMGDKISLGFMAETENQVEEHLNDHLQRLPVNDLASRAVVEQMKLDETEHAQTALHHGGQPLPLPARLGMKFMAKVMKTVAYRV